MPLGKSHHRKPTDSSGPIDVNVVSGGVVPDPLDVNLVDTSSVEPLDVNVVSGGSGSQPITSATLIDTISVGTTEVELKVGATPLAGRFQVALINDSSYFVHVAFTNPFTLSQSFQAFSGEAIIFDLDPATVTNVYMKTAEGTAIIRIAEIK
jgi:hypothetical protein